MALGAVSRIDRDIQGFSRLLPGRLTGAATRSLILALHVTIKQRDPALRRYEAPPPLFVVLGGNAGGRKGLQAFPSLDACNQSPLHCRKPVAILHQLCAANHRAVTGNDPRIRTAGVVRPKNSLTCSVESRSRTLS